MRAKRAPTGMEEDEEGRRDLDIQEEGTMPARAQRVTSDSAGRCSFSPAYVQLRSGLDRGVGRACSQGRIETPERPLNSGYTRAIETWDTTSLVVPTFVCLLEPLDELLHLIHED